MTADSPKKSSPFRIRSFMFCPGNSNALVAKIPRADADVSAVDLEDAIPAPDKETARVMANTACAALREDGWTGPVFLRVNSLYSPWFVDDLRNADLDLFDGIVIPKAESARDLSVIESVLKSRGRNLQDVPVILGFESARGVEHVEELLADFRPTAIYFGAEDYVRSVGGRRSRGGSEVQYARSRIAAWAGIYALPAVDQAVADIRDKQLFIEDGAFGVSLGYQGKLCMNPQQSRWANSLFVPTEAEVSFARAVLATLESVGAEGRGVAVVEGIFIDDVAAKQAKHVLYQAGVDAGTVSRSEEN